jgi:hypothetical protein
MNSVDPCPGKSSCPTPAIGLTVKLDRDIDRQRPCHDNVAIIQPGKPPHAGELRCATCGAHRGWASKALLDFVVGTMKRFGAPQTVTWRKETRLDIAARQGGATAP